MSYVTYNKMLTAKPSDQSRAFTKLLPDMPTGLREKTERVLEELKGCGKVIVAFSGGIDSTLVTSLAKIALDDNAIAVTADSPSLPSSELEEAKQLAGRIGIRHIVVRTEELEDPNYVTNPNNRCYFCKKELSEKLRGLARELRVPAIVDGTNADDMHGHRPGADALSENGVRRPLADAGMTKAEVRQLSQLLGLPNFNKPSMPCLSSRIQCGQTITPERLKRIEKSEKLIRTLTGVHELRVRDHGDLARIEVGKTERQLFFNEELLDKIGEALREFGFAYVAFDVFGYRSGSMNEPLGPSVRSKLNPT